MQVVMDRPQFGGVISLMVAASRRSIAPAPVRAVGRARSSIDGDPSFSTHLSLCSAGVTPLHRSYEEVRLLGGHRLVVVASFRPTADRGPVQTFPGKNTGCPAAA